MVWKRKRLEALGDEDFNDVYLVGTDGEEVACSKLILSTQSPVFKSMFFRGFREQRADRCTLEFHSVVISLVVQYCYSGELDTSTKTMGYPKSYQGKAALLVELREAGRYFELEEVRIYAENRIGELVFEKNSSQYACAFLTELFKRGEDDGPIWSALFEFAVENPDRCFGEFLLQHNGNTTTTTTCCHPHASVLIKVLEKLSDTFIVVKCLQTWIIRENLNDGGSSDDEKQALTDFAKTVDLKKLSRNQLSKLFKERSCALFPSERILEAVFHQLDDQELQNSQRRRLEKRFYVSGAAGVEDLNGFYLQMRQGEEKVNLFCKRGHFGGRDCLFLIHYKQTELKWLLSITDESFMLDPNGDIKQDHIQLQAYEAAGKRESVPFNGWNCLKGADPAPIIARIDGYYAL